MKSSAVPALIALLLVALSAGCTSHRPRLNCDGHLKPINTPAPLTPGEAAHP